MARVLIGWIASLLVSWQLVACGESAQGGDTQTNWLKECRASAECGDLECVCGRCTEPCEASECGGVPEEAVCLPATNQGVQRICEGSEATALCLRGCETAAQCDNAEQCLDGACVPGIGPPVGTADDAAGFCQLWIDRFAAYMASCGCGAEAASRYREQIASECAVDGFFGGLAAAVERGELRYDAAAATALFARLDAPDPLCVEEPYRNVRLDSLEVYSLAGVFSGTRGLGEPCSLPVSYKGGISDCSEGVCASDDAGAGVCIALVNLDQECDASGDENLRASSPRLCHATLPADSDGEYERSFDGLSCLEGVCARDLENGLPCRLDDVCSSGRCASDAQNLTTCQPKAGPGEACDTSIDCQAGACRHDVTPPVCGELLADGSPCTYDAAACASGHCSDANDGICIPPASAPIGSACTVDAECIGDAVCRGGLCFADICGDYLD